MNLKETITNITKKPAFIPTVVGVSSLAVGFGVGYILGKKRSTEIIQFVKEQPEQLSLLDYVSDQEFPVDETGKVVINAVQDIVDHQGSTTKVNYNEIATKPVVKDEDPPPIINVFRANNTTDWDYDAEVSARDHSLPYIIHKDEFDLEEMDFRQDTVTYYEGDDIMADSLDVPIHNFKEIMGELRFGHGSGDPNVVYIRNENLNLEWEVLRHSGSFATEVMGLEYDNLAEEELRHSNTTVRKFRPD